MGQGGIKRSQAPDAAALMPSKTPAGLGTQRVEDTQGLTLMLDITFKRVRANRSLMKTLAIPFPGLGLVELELQEHCNVSDNFVISRSKAEGHY